jgi:hypothetical protein
MSPGTVRPPGSHWLCHWLCHWLTVFKDVLCSGRVILVLVNLMLFGISRLWTYWLSLFTLGFAERNELHAGDPQGQTMANEPCKSRV